MITLNSVRFLRESSDVVDTRTSFRLSTASFNRDMGLKISTASTSVQLRRMVKSWGTAGARSRSDTLPKRHILARAREDTLRLCRRLLLGSLCVLQKRHQMYYLLS